MRKECFCEPGKSCGYTQAAKSIVRSLESGIISLTKANELIFRNYALAKKSEGCLTPEDLFPYFEGAKPPPKRIRSLETIPSTIS